MARFYGSGSFNTADYVFAGNGRDFVGTGAYVGVTFKRIHDFKTGFSASTPDGPLPGPGWPCSPALVRSATCGAVA